MYIINIKRVLIVVLIIAVLMVLVGLVMYGVNNQSDVDLTLIAIGNGTTVSVPVSNVSDITNNEYGVIHYTDPQYNVSIVCWNSEEQLLVGEDGNVQNEIATIKGSNDPIDENGILIYQNGDIYSIETGNNDTHDNLLISCSDKELLVKVYATVKFGVSDFSRISNSTHVKTVDKNNNTTNATRYVVDEYGTYDTQNGTYIDGEYAGLTRTQIEQYYYTGSNYYDDGSYYYDDGSYYYDDGSYYYDDGSYYYDDGSYYQYDYYTEYY